MNAQLLTLVQRRKVSVDMEMNMTNIDAQIGRLNAAYNKLIEKEMGGLFLP